MGQRDEGARKSDGESVDFRRLAAQLGISARVLLDEEAAATTATSRHGSGGAGTRSDRRARHNQTTNEVKEEDDKEDVLSVARQYGSDDDEDELEESLDQYQYDSVEIPDSLVLASDSNSLSASESISSELSLPRSFGQYDAIQPPGGVAGGRRKPFSGISQFDDHLMHFPTGPAPHLARRTGSGEDGSGSGSGSAVAADRANAGATLARIHGASGGASGGTSGGSDMMKKFYEVQVEKIRSQLVLATQAQRQLEKTLQAERQSWQERLTAMEQELEVEKSRLTQENATARSELQSMKKRLKLEKTHFASLQISEALAEQLSRQEEQDLSIREFIQLSVHHKVSKLEIDLEASRKELEELQRVCANYKASASSTSDEAAQARRAADAKEMRLQHELELAQATRQEMERQIAALCLQVDAMKNEQRQHDVKFSNRTSLQEDFDRIKADASEKESAHNLLRVQHDELLTKHEELEQRVALLSADKSFLMDAKAHLEEHEALLLKKQQDLLTKIEALQTKHQDDVSQSLHFQNETRLHFEKKMDDELSKFLELSKSELERIRNSGQIVYERENRLLKEARDDALKQAEMLQVKLDLAQSALEEKVLELTRMESHHTTSLANLRNDLKMKHFEMNQLKMSMEEQITNCRAGRLEIEMLDQKLQVHKDEFAKLESTSTTKITQLEAALDIERNKLKEYEQLEIDLDDAVLQTGAIFNGENEVDDENSSPAKLNEVMTTFGAIPTSNKRRFQQSVSLAQRVVKYQRESLEFQQKLKEANAERTRLELELKQLKAQLANFHQPQSYLIDKLTRKEQELQAALKSSAQLEQQMRDLRSEYSQAMEAKMSLQKQLQQVLARREDLDVLKSSVQLLRQKLQAKNSQQHQQQASPSLAFKLNQIRSEKQSGSINSLDDGAKMLLHQDEDKALPFMKVSPPPSIASKMTEAPASSQQFAPSFATAADREQPQGSTTTSPPRWYTKLRS